MSPSSRDDDGSGAGSVEACWEVAALPHGSVPDQSEELFRSFVRECARSPEVPEMVDRLRLGHDPDGNGWCLHPAHSHRWERHPCFTRRLADLVDGTAPQVG